MALRERERGRRGNERRMTSDSTAKALLQAYFLKIHIEEKDIQEKLQKIFFPTLKAIMSYIPLDERIRIIPIFLVCVTNCAKVLQARNDPAMFEFCEGLFGGICNLITVIITSKIKESKKTLRTADRILHEAFFDHLTCDIGDLIRKLREAKTSRDRKIIMSGLKVLLADYNEISGADIKLSDLIEGKKKCEKMAQST